MGKSESVEGQGTLHTMDGPTRLTCMFGYTLVLISVGRVP